MAVFSPPPFVGPAAGSAQRLPAGQIVHERKRSPINNAFCSTAYTMPQSGDSINRVLQEIAEAVKAGVPQAIDNAALRYSANDLGALIQRGLLQLERNDQSGRLLVVPTPAGWHRVAEAEADPTPPTVPPPNGEQGA